MEVEVGANFVGETDTDTDSDTATDADADADPDDLSIRVIVDVWNAALVEALETHRWLAQIIDGSDPIPEPFVYILFPPPTKADEILW